MKNLWSNLSFKKIKKTALDHKIISAIVLVVLFGGGYWSYGKLTDTSGETKYVVSAVEKGTIVSTITGTGQVSASNQLNITSKVSGDLVYLGVKSGQKVSAGTLIAQVDAGDAQASLESAQIALAKLKEPADKLSIVQAENALASALDTKEKSYSDGFSAVDSAFLDMPIVMTGLDNLFNNYNASTYFSNDWNLGDTAKNYRQIASNSYYRAKTAYDKNVIDYRNVSRTSASSSIESIVKETALTAKMIAQALKETNTAISYVIDQTDTRYRTAVMTADTNNLNTWSTEMNGHVSSLNLIADTIDNADRTIADKQESLIKLKEGADALDIRSQELNVEQKQNALNDYYIRAPFAGTVAKLDIEANDSISGGTAIATLITDSKLADISLNEVDVSKVKTGQKVTLTFDAIEGLTVTGVVSAVDQVGTVSQGVVNYNVRISFDTQDVRVLPGMSVNAAIATAAKQDVLIVPNGAVKTQSGTSYVEILDQSVGVTDNQGVALTVTPTRQTVTIGISDDLSVEILSGLKEGDKIITRTIAPSATKTTASAPSIFGGSGASRTTSGASRGAAVGGFPH